MKKTIITIIFILLGSIAIGAMFYAGSVLHKKENNLDAHLRLISYDELKSKINQKETFIIVISQETCSHCAEYKPVLKQVLTDYDITAFELDESKLSKEETEELKTLLSFNGNTPTTIFFTKGEELQLSSRLIGAATRDKIIARLKAMGYIEK